MSSIKRNRVVVVAVVALVGMAFASCESAPTDPNNPDLPLDADGKTPICHHQQDIGTWTRTLLSLQAAREHLAVHDDAVPGGLTAITNTRLDNQCKRVTESP